MSKKCVRGDSSQAIPPNKPVNVKGCSHIYEVSYISSISHVLENYKKISKNRMVDKTTGEIIEVEPSNNRADNIISLRRTIKKLRDLINANFEGAKNELFITLTYAENMTDYKRLYSDFVKFFKRLSYRYKDIEFLYIYTIEPQERGAWHIHLLLKGLNVQELFIPNDTVGEIWGHGFTKTRRLDEVDNVGAYLSTYLADVLDDTGKKKGARLKLYPAGINIYRCSRNVKKPEVWRMTYEEARSFLTEEHKTYEVAYDIYSESGELLNFVKKEFFNLKRKTR